MEVSRQPYPFQAVASALAGTAGTGNIAGIVEHSFGGDKLIVGIIIVFLAEISPSPVAHATATTDHSVRQGMWSLFGVFVDTSSVCTRACLVIVITPVLFPVEKLVQSSPRVPFKPDSPVPEKVEMKGFLRLIFLSLTSTKLCCL